MVRFSVPADDFDPLAAVAPNDGKAIDLGATFEQPGSAAGLVPARSKGPSLGDVSDDTPDRQCDRPGCVALDATLFFVRLVFHATLYVVVNTAICVGGPSSASSGPTGW